jgi:hypothetical protein
MAAVARPVAVGGALTPPAPPPRSGTVRDEGSARHDRLRAALWTASGPVKVLGDVDVGEATLAGIVAVGGTLSADALRARGGLEVAGTVQVRGALVVEGTARLGAPARARSIEVRGQLRSDAAIAAERELRVVGLLEAPSASAGLVDLRGAVAVPGEIVARASVTGHLRDDSTLGTVRAPLVALHGPPTGFVPTLWRKVFGGEARITVERLEADRAELESVDVRFVHAKEIVLGPQAHVAEIEGRIVRRHRTARVGPESRSAPPYGLWR